MYCNVSAIQKVTSQGAMILHAQNLTKVEHKMEIYVGIYSFIN